MMKTKFGLETGGVPALVLIGMTVGVFVLRMIAQILNWPQAFAENTAEGSIQIKF